MKKLPFFIALLFFVSCQNDDNSDYVAKVKDQYLSKKELSKAISNVASKEDSIKMANLFVDNWVRKQVVINQANLNLSDYQKDVKIELENYKQDLIIYRYERELLKQKLDTTISREELEAYYLENIEMFKLKDYAIQAIYASFPLAFDGQDEVKKIIKNYSSKDSLALRQICEDPEMKCYLKSNDWIYLKNLMSEVPLTFYNEERFLKKDKFAEFEENGTKYLLLIRNFKLKDSYSPIDLETQNIRSLILNGRKLKLLENMRNELFQKALNNGDIEIKK